jgi:hypothetical protein
MIVLFNSMKTECSVLGFLGPRDFNLPHVIDDMQVALLDPSLLTHRQHSAPWCLISHIHDLITCLNVLLYHHKILLPPRSTFECRWVSW